MHYFAICTVGEGRKGGPAVVETLYYKVHSSKCKYSTCRKVDRSRAEREG